MKSRKPSTKAVQAWIDRGDGQGIGLNYQPFFKVRDVPSRGRSRMFLGITCRRIYHYLSDLEYYYHLLAEYDQTAVDIRDQYALLPWHETQEIAHELGIRHPTYPGTTTPIVMTSDQLITKMRPNGERDSVISIKYASELDISNSDTEEPKSWRVLEKLYIENIYWARRGIPWKVGTEKDISLIRVHNLNFLRMNLVAEEFDILNPKLPFFVEMFMDFWRSDSTLLVILQSVATKLKLEGINHSFALFARAVWLRLLPADIDTKAIHHHQPLYLTLN